MNITKREKILLIALGIVIFVVLFFKFYFMPQLNNISVYRSQISQYSQNVEVNMAYKKKVENMDSSLKITNQKLKDLRAEFPPKINSDEIVMLVSKMGKDSGVDIKNLSLEEASPVDLGANNADKKGVTTVSGITDNKLLAALGSLGLTGNLASGINPGSVDNTKKTSVPDGKAYVFSVKISAAGTNKEIKKFFKSAEELKVKAMFNDISLANSSDGTISLNVSLNFYGIMDRNAGLYTLLPEGGWTPKESARKDNIFEAYQGYTASTDGVSPDSSNKANNVPGTTTEDMNTDIYDFSMTASSFGGSLAPPSVSIVCRSAARNSSAVGVPLVYGDSKGIENVDLYIEEKSGSYFCRYKTNQAQFPEKNYNNMFEFEPKGDSIKMIVAASKILDKQDVARAVLNITNKTSKKFEIEILYDDKTNPRFTVKPVGDVEFDYK